MSGITIYIQIMSVHETKCNLPGWVAGWTTVFPVASQATIPM